MEMADKFGTGAVRSTDADDVRYDLISPIGLDAVAKTCAEGAGRYGDFNWERGFPAHDLLNHAIRHIYKFLEGDRSEPHLPHAAWGVLAAIHSVELWPHLNAGKLRGPGCTPPGVKHWTERLSADSAEPGAMVYLDDEPIGTLPDDEVVAALSGLHESPAEGPPSELVSMLSGLRASAESLFGPAGKPASRTPTLSAGDMTIAGLDTPATQQAPAAPSPAPAGAIPSRLAMLAARWVAENRKPVLYLSGPMSGIERYNFPAFNAAANVLREAGFPVINPADFGEGKPGREWADHLQRDLYILGESDILVQLAGWDQSRGASLECSVAEKFARPVLSFHEAAMLGRLLGSR